MKKGTIDFSDITENFPTNFLRAQTCGKSPEIDCVNAQSDRFAGATGDFPRLDPEFDRFSDNTEWLRCGDFSSGGRWCGSDYFSEARFGSGEKLVGNGAEIRRIDSPLDI